MFLKKTLFVLLARASLAPFAWVRGNTSTQWPCHEPCEVPKMTHFPADQGIRSPALICEQLAARGKALRQDASVGKRTEA
jgi:hypothetical protein